MLAIKPTPVFKRVLKVYPSLYAASRDWKIDYNTLRRFVEEGSSMHLANAMSIAQATGKRVEELFELRDMQFDVKLAKIKGGE